MSDTPRTHDWLGPARDCLKDRGLDDAADALARLPTVEERLERAMEILENVVSSLANGNTPRWGRHRPAVGLIAEHRGETREATLARLSPADTRPSFGSPTAGVDCRSRDVGFRPSLP